MHVTDVGLKIVSTYLNSHNLISKQIQYFPSKSFRVLKKRKLNFLVSRVKFEKILVSQFKNQQRTADHRTCKINWFLTSFFNNFKLFLVPLFSFLHFCNFNSFWILMSVNPLFQISLYPLSSKPPLFVSFQPLSLPHPFYFTNSPVLILQ